MNDTKRLILDFRGRPLTQVLTVVSRSNLLLGKKIVDAIFDDEENDRRSPENMWDVILVPTAGRTPRDMGNLARQRGYELIPDRAALLLREFSQEELGYPGIIMPRYNLDCFGLSERSLWEIGTLGMIFPLEVCAWAFVDAA